LTPVYGLTPWAFNLALQPIEFGAKLVFGSLLLGGRLLATPLVKFAPEFLKRSRELADLFTQSAFIGFISIVVALLSAIGMKIASRTVQFTS
jgi:hypothetical protein